MGVNGDLFYFVASTECSVDELQKDACVRRGRAFLQLSTNKWDYSGRMLIPGLIGNRDELSRKRIDNHISIDKSYLKWRVMMGCCWFCSKNLEIKGVINSSSILVDVNSVCLTHGAHCLPINQNDDNGQDKNENQLGSAIYVLKYQLISSAQREIL